MQAVSEMTFNVPSKLGHLYFYHSKPCLYDSLFLSKIVKEMTKNGAFQAWEFLN